MGEEGQHMDDILYRAAQLRGANIPGPAEVNFQSRTMGDRNNALHVAAQYNNHEFIRGVVDQLGQYRYQLLCQQNSKGETPLHLAAQLGHVETARVLVRAHYHEEGAGGPFNYPRRPCWSERDERGDTPLHKALRNGREDTAMFLLETDFQVVSVDNNAGESVAYLAAESFCSKFLARILDAHNRYFLSFSGPFGLTVFHPARRLTKELMQKLIEIRGRPHLKIQDKEGKTVVQYAVEEDRRTMVMALLSAESSLAYVHDNDGLTPLHMAFKKGLFGMVRVILEVCPQSLEIRDSHGKTALHNAEMYNTFLAKCSTIAGMNLLINQVDDDGNTPLHVALINSKQDAAFQLLWFSGCNWRLRNKEGYNPLDLCKSNHKISYMSAVHVALRDLEGVRQGLRIRKWIEIRFLASIRSICWVTLDGMEEKKLKKLLNEIAVAAALLLPLNFITAFNVPGGYDKNTGQPMLRNQFAFQLFNYSNMAAFFATVCILFSCTFGFGKRMSKKRLAQCSILLIQVALITTISAYFFGLLAIGSTSYWGSAVIIFIVLVIELSIMN